jgi:hypothetical protein
MLVKICKHSLSVYETRLYQWKIIPMSVIVRETIPHALVRFSVVSFLLNTRENYADLKVKTISIFKFKILDVWTLDQSIVLSENYSQRNFAVKLKKKSVKLTNFVMNFQTT